MGEQSDLQKSLFTDDDHLQLIQLTTRKAMADRIARGVVAQTEDGEPDATPVDVRITGELPAQWTLLPRDLVLHSWQQQCLPIWMAQGRGTVKVATGGGKTTFALAVAQALQNTREPDLRLVVVVPTVPLMFQWRDEVVRGDVPPTAIALMGGGQELPPLDGIRVLICVLNSARDRLADLVSKEDWSRRMLLVVDECHRSGAEQAARIFKSNARYTLGLSATPERDQDAGDLPSDSSYNDGVVGQALGPIIFEFSLKQSLDAGLLTPFEVWHIGVPLSSDEAVEHGRLSREITELRKGLQARFTRARSKQGFLAWCQTQASRGGDVSGDATRFIGLSNQRKRLLYRAAARTQVTLNILADAAQDPESRSIVFHESIEEIECYFMDALAVGIPAVLEHSKLPDSLRNDSIDAFRRGIARTIISAKSLVEGFNVPSADVGVIAASSGSVRQRIQSLGRMLRRKAGGRGARIFVLYVRDSEDEVIYEKADWEGIVGAAANRYFVLNTETVEPWPAGLVEVGAPPRAYRPPSFEVDVSGMSTGDSYPGQTAGRNVKLDHNGNLRDDGGALIQVPDELRQAFGALSAMARGCITPAGHLITRVDPQGASEADWRFVGVIDLAATAAASATTDTSTVIRLRIKRTSGRRAIAREDGKSRGNVPFARDTSRAKDPAAGAACEVLLAWIADEERRLNVSVNDLFWDGAGQYWLELQGERIPYGGSLAALEFAE